MGVWQAPTKAYLRSMFVSHRTQGMSLIRHLYEEVIPSHNSPLFNPRQM